MEKLNYNQATFTASYAKLEQLPPDNLREVIFVGRSNVGKSSVINALTRQKKLAKTSNTPGRTQLLNYFTLSTDCFLVDLPGYGYAKVNRKTKQEWEETLSGYLSHRQSIVGIVIIMDCRHPLKPQDSQMIRWATHSQIPTHILLNKSDKLSNNGIQKTLAAVRKQVPHASIQAFSAHNKTGLGELSAQLDTFFLGKRN